MTGLRLGLMWVVCPIMAGCAGAETSPRSFGGETSVSQPSEVRHGGAAQVWDGVIEGLDDSTTGPGDDVAGAFSCIAGLGINGCGFEQPLEAALKALSPAAPNASTGAAYRPPTFFRNTFGHGDGANDGFVREGTLLAVVVVSDGPLWLNEAPRGLAPERWGSGGTGRRSRLKICRGQPHPGSSPGSPAPPHRRLGTAPLPRRDGRSAPDVHHQGAARGARRQRP